MQTANESTCAVWLRLSALVLAIAALGLPVNDLFRYFLLLAIAVSIFSATITRAPRRWLAAIAVIALAWAGQILWPAPQIEEGHNVFITDGSGGALQRNLPADAFRQMSAEFDARYPPDRRCDPAATGCWRSGRFPDRPYAFSADAIYNGAAYSRRVNGIDFFDPVWLRLGFINETRYNWQGASDIQRGRRNRWGNLLHPWQLSVPYFVMYQLPAEFSGGQLCWQGLVLWEDTGKRFDAARNSRMACRTIKGDDIGRRIFGVSIGAPLAMTLDAPLAVKLRQAAQPLLALLAVGTLLVLLVRMSPRRLILPAIFIGPSLVVVLLHDLSFVGGVRPFEGGDDGLVYEGFARQIVQHALNGEFAQALMGVEKVYYYGGPGMRYFRAAEHFIFGDTFLGYLSLMLLLPFIVFAVFKRFIGARGALGMTLIFIALPIGALFGTTFYQYVKWAARGFADPGAAALFLGGLAVLVGRTEDDRDARFWPALGAALLFASALWLRPNLAPGAGILLAGAGLAALYQRQIHRVAGLCLGFIPVLGMALHNWVFGGVFVLFSSNITTPANFPMPPSAYVEAFGELLHLEFSGAHVWRGLLQIAGWLTGPSESFSMIPIHALSLAILIRVVCCGRLYESWLRLIAAAAIAQHPVALFYQSSARYYFLAWLLTFLVTTIWMKQEGLPLFQRWFPGAAKALAEHPIRFWLGRALDWWVRITAISPSGLRKERISAAASGGFATPPSSKHPDAIDERTRQP